VKVKPKPNPSPENVPVVAIFLSILLF